MNRIRVGVIAGLALALTLAVAPAVSAAPLGDRASGFGVRAPIVVGNEGAHFAFDAKSARDGSAPSGWFDVQFPGFGGFNGLVDCLMVNGRWATITGHLTAGWGQGDPALFGGSTVYMVMIVHGRGGQRGASPAPDTMSSIDWDTAAAIQQQYGVAEADICTQAQAIVGTDMFSLVAGNIRVKDRH